MKRLTRLWFPLLLLALFSQVGRADEAAIQKFLRDYVDAFNKQDLEAVAGMWAEKGVFVDRSNGDRKEGRAAIKADLAEVPV